MDTALLIMGIPYLPLALLVPASVRWYRTLSPAFKAIAWFVWFNALTQVIAQVFHYFSMNNLPVLHIYTPVGFAALALFYHVVLRGYIPRYLMALIAVLFAVLCIVVSARYQPLTKFNSIALTVQGVLLCIFSLATYALLLNQTVRQEKRTLLRALSWTNSGIFLYFASSLLLFHFGDLLITLDQSDFRISWIFHSFVSTILYTSLLVGLWKHPRS